MTTRKERLIRRNELIVSKFLKLSEKKYKNKIRLYSRDAILEMLSDEFHLSSRTIEDIIFARIEYKSRK